VRSMFGHKTQTPRIEIDYNESNIDLERKVLQLDIDEARAHAMNLLQACEASIQDAFIIDFAKELGLDEPGRYAMLQQFRTMRRDRQDPEGTRDTA
jgi:hypothetical protein